MDDRERRIRDRACEVWEAAGHPKGRELEHWRLLAISKFNPPRRIDN